MSVELKGRIRDGPSNVRSRFKRGNLSARKTFTVGLIYLAVLLCEYIVADRHLKDACALFALIAIYNSFVFLESRRDLLAFLFPSSLGINYLYISLFIGAIGFYTNNIVVPYMRTDPPLWEDSVVPNLFLASVVACVVIFSNYKQIWASLVVQKRNPAKIVFILAVFALTIFLYLNTEFLFGEQVLGAQFAIYLLYVFGFRTLIVRFTMYSLAFLPFSLAMSHSKREALFFLYSILVVEVIMGKWGKVDLRRILLALSIAFAMCALILVVTVVRNAHVFEVGSLAEILGAVKLYLSFDYFAAYFLLNIEATYTYFHVMNAIDFSLKEISPLLWGETYIKPFFIWLPREWVEWKPRSAIDHYTTIFDPYFRAAGGSWVISMLGEAFLNFRMAGAIACAAIICMLDRIFRTFVLHTRGGGLMYSVGGVYFGVAVLTFTRGSGLELALIQMIVVVASAIPFAVVLNYRGGLHVLYRREVISRAGQIVRRIFVFPPRKRSMPIDGLPYRNK